jgi:hypothetical protein
MEAIWFGLGVAMIGGMVGYFMGVREVFNKRLNRIPKEGDFLISDYAGNTVITKVDQELGRVYAISEAQGMVYSFSMVFLEPHSASYDVEVYAAINLLPVNVTPYQEWKKEQLS